MFKITKTIYVHPDGSRSILHHEVCVEDLNVYKKQCHPNKGETILLEYEDLSNPASPESESVPNPAPVPTKTAKRKGRPPLGKEVKNRPMRLTQGEYILIKCIRNERLTDEEKKIFEAYYVSHLSFIAQVPGM